MEGWDAAQVARAAGAVLVRDGAGEPAQATLDSRTAAPGELFVGLPGTRVDGGAFAPGALAHGAWGVLVAPAHVPAALEAGGDGAVLEAADPLRALQRLATAWREHLGAQVIGITGSVGKTSTKDLLAAMLVAAEVPAVATAANLNTEIGLPLTILTAPAGTQVLVLEMGMRGPGQIAELAAIARPDVGVITALGPVHLEQMGSMEAIAAEKASLIAALAPGAIAVLPAGEPLLEPHRRADLRTVTFGPGGEVTEDDLAGLGLDGRPAHLRRNAQAALAAARAVGATPKGPIEVRLSALRGQRVALPEGVTLIEDCYNANPVSMRAALDDLAASPTAGRRVAVLGDMRELGPEQERHHREIGEHARALGVDVLLAVGPLSAAYAAREHVPDAAAAAARLPALVGPGDTVLLKASRGIGLEVAGQALREHGPGR